MSGSYRRRKAPGSASLLKWLSTSSSPSSSSPPSVSSVPSSPSSLRPQPPPPPRRPSPPPTRRPAPPPPSSPSTTPRFSYLSHIFLYLVAFRLLNALILRTFFQPDEFFQSLEPAWQAAFGEDRGAWITWEWRHQLRSSIHPLLFAALYSVTDFSARLVHFSPAIRADLLIAVPKVAQAIISATGDLYTWKLAQSVYGRRSPDAWATLALTVLSPWQWFCSTRTLSNCLETTITIVALSLWPWEWSYLPSSQAKSRRTSRTASKPTERDSNIDGAFIFRLRQCLLLAAVACILRPTNVLIWISIGSVAWLQSTWRERKILCREVILCGVSVLTLSSTLDRLFYGFWTFPPFRFLYFNIAQSLAVFYGKNDWHYYISQGYPLLLTTALPFTVVGIYRVLARSVSHGVNSQRSSVRTQLAAVCLIMPVALSLISHKEVRFIYPLLPLLHILTAPTLVDFFLPAVSSPSRAYMPRRLSLIFLLLVNITIALYTTVYHASGAIGVLSYLRNQQQVHALASPGAAQQGITAGFLMPCHSTPWRSHLVHPNIHAWALSCEPPVDMSEKQKAVYVDEADQFYNNPSQFLRGNMRGGLWHVPRKPTYSSSKNLQVNPQAYQQSRPHEWPDYLIFFSPLEPTLRSLLRSSSYGECWRTWNTAWHDDSRRRGDIIVWCLDPTEQAAWRSVTQKRHVETRDRQFDRIMQTFKKEASGKQRISPWGRWMSSLRDGTRSFTWAWPWQSQKRTWLGIQLPAWKKSSWKLPVSWTWPSLPKLPKLPKLPNMSKKKTKSSSRDLWS
ncbi:Alg9-like mannosyltransferase family-domain-containing protein [Aspergillus avenaceus]|uniref:Mannosyltransferase n=1 Tax=Aspergillus avenaceus TaxID=36643 RepID=A0A5N6TSC1_ASPAV|nr:Alg9-like mannosyltransferase family-domain-containing protein [Aspergillus avenaceus]